MCTLCDMIDYVYYTNAFYGPLDKLQGLLIAKWLQMTKSIEYCNKNSFIYKKILYILHSTIIFYTYII